MSAGRDALLNQIRRSLGKTHGERARVVQERLEGGKRGPALGRINLPRAQHCSFFVEMATRAGATIRQLATREEVPAAVRDFMEEHDLPREAVLAPEPEIGGLAWDQTGLVVRTGRAEKDDHTAITPVFAGIVETGTLCVCSGPDHPSTLNILPYNHIAVLRVSRVVPAYEDAWDLVRKRYGPGMMPRTVLWITGPSLTGDIEQTLQRGAHGPRRLHILLIEDEDFARV